jgi:hypothetical protein
MRKRDRRQLLAAVFVFVAFAELGSHVIIDSQVDNLPPELAACRLSEAPSNRADCPEQRRQQKESKNLMDEVTTHMVVLNDLTMPHSGIMYRSISGFSHSAKALSGETTLPFHPPKQA